ncbi:MAG: threonine--tRNA ligase [Oscillospiraceae bacterium]|nr:threonine--tRNA ligase [Oscillospiraceae bacterium]
MINITLKNGDIRQFEEGILIIDIVKSINQKLIKTACCCLLSDKIVDLRDAVYQDETLEILTFDDLKGKEAFWHTSAHILAHAVVRLYPSAKLSIGPAIENGFFYDFEVDTPFSTDDLSKIEKEAKKIIKQNPKIDKKIISKEQSIEIMTEKNQPYKIKLIEEISSKDNDISIYSQDDFIDLCAGPHILNISSIKGFKILQTTGAYFKGDSKNKQLSRIYGISFPTTQQIDEYIKSIEEAKKRDHNIIGRQLKYFTTNENVGQGLPLIMHKGAKVLQILQRYVEDLCEKNEYFLTKTPFMAKNDLYKISGHWQHYQDGMFVIGDEKNSDDILALRPMTCPFQFMIYNSDIHSYKNLPIRYFENSTLCRNESSGEMHGLIRLRQFTLSDGHTITTDDMLDDEFEKILNLIQKIMKSIGIENDIFYRFSKWDPQKKDKYIDDPIAWKNTEDKMKNILDNLDINYNSAIGEAAFYGPKLDIQMKNVHGKEDTIITIQIDFSLAERFNMTYIDSDGIKKHPYIIHHSLIGCYERTLALLIEKYSGDLPLWISPLHCRILPISDIHKEYSESIKNILQKHNILVEIDSTSEKIGYKIRKGQLDKVPYMLILGDKEVSSNNLSIRSRKHGESFDIPHDTFIQNITDEIKNKII